ncbi:hypothetical protein EV121DRAFT_274600, partial [Schizophyllum commune]
SSNGIIHSVEQRFRENMKNLPTHVANTFRGVINTYGMEQQIRMDRLDARFSAMESLLSQVAYTGASSSRKRKVPPTISFPPVNAVHPSGSTSTLAHSDCHQGHSTVTSGDSVQPQEAVRQPMLAASHLDHSKPMTAASNVSAAQPEHIQALPSALQIYQPGIHELATSSHNDKAAKIRDNAMEALFAKYGKERVVRHEWDWVESTTATPARFLPRYLYTRKKQVLDSGRVKEEPLSVEDLWQEHISGLDGQLSVMQLNDGWGGSWKRNIASEKSEGSRRSKLVALIEALQKRPNWTSSLALQFLRERYPIDRQSPFAHLRFTRNFMEWLQRTKEGNNFAMVLDSANSYHGT